MSNTEKIQQRLRSLQGAMIKQLLLAEHYNGREVAADVVQIVELERLIQSVGNLSNAFDPKED